MSKTELSFVVFCVLFFVNRRSVQWMWHFSILTSKNTAGFSRYSDDKTCTDPTKALKQRQRCMSLFHTNDLKDGDDVVQWLASLAQIPRGPGPFLRLQVLPGPTGIPVGSSHSLKTCTGELGGFVTPSWPIEVNVNGYLSLYVGPLMSSSRAYPISRSRILMCLKSKVIKMTFMCLLPTQTMRHFPEASTQWTTVSIILIYKIWTYAGSLFKIV